MAQDGPISAPASLISNGGTPMKLELAPWTLKDAADLRAAVECGRSV
jgi:hypothetical protein